VSRAADALSAIAPALAFLCTGVPLAALLDRLGFFESVARLLQRGAGPVALWKLWGLAAATTAVLNLDTTVVLLTPLYIRLARRANVDPLPVAIVPLLLASLASSFLPVSNLTSLIVVDATGAGVGDVVTRLALPSLAAVAGGWLAYRRHFPNFLPPTGPEAVDRRAVTIGGAVVSALLVMFTVGPVVGVDPWMAALGADVLLVAITRHLPWRSVPVGTAALVAIVAAFTAIVVPTSIAAEVQQVDGPVALGGLVIAGAAVANAVNNLPATLAVLHDAHDPTNGIWAWLLGVNVGAVLLPTGALANLLWWSIAVEEDVPMTLARYVRHVVPVGLPALGAAAITFAVAAAV